MWVSQPLDQHTAVLFCTAPMQVEIGGNGANWSCPSLEWTFGELQRKGGFPLGYFSLFLFVSKKEQPFWLHWVGRWGRGANILLPHVISCSGTDVTNSVWATLTLKALCGDDDKIQTGEERSKFSVECSALPFTKKKLVIFPFSLPALPPLLPSVRGS